MTGYGRSEQETGGKIVTCEMRCLNSRYLDPYIILENMNDSHELWIREKIQKELQRGQIRIRIRVEDSEGRSTYTLDKGIVEKLSNDLKDVCKKYDLPLESGTSPIIEKAIKKEEILSEEITPQDLYPLIDEAINNVNEYRATEGGSLSKELRAQIEVIEDLLTDVDPLENERAEKTRMKLQELISKTSEPDFNRDRMEQELLIHLDRMDISEEKIRLKEHCRYFISTMEENYIPKGKKLNFISQEIGREINTLGAKSYYAPMQHLVVSMKEALEKIKELVANVL